MFLDSVNSSSGLTYNSFLHGDFNFESLPPPSIKTTKKDTPSSSTTTALKSTESISKRQTADILNHGAERWNLHTKSFYSGFQEFMGAKLFVGSAACGIGTLIGAGNVPPPLQHSLSQLDDAPSKKTKKMPEDGRSTSGR